MLLRTLDALSKNDRDIKGLSTITAVGATARAAAISTTFTRSKGSGSGKGDLPIADASSSVEWLFVRSRQPVANADDGSGMPPLEGYCCPCL